MHINAISNGQGAPSTYLIVLAGEGKISASVSITGDTGWENDMLWSDGHRSTSREYFERITRPLAESYGMEAYMIRTLDKHKKPYPNLQDSQYLGHIDIPIFGSMGGRYKQACTSKWKIRAVRQRLRQLGATTATTALGLTMDEVHRMKPSDVKWHNHIYPLIVDLKMYRVMVQDELSKRNIPWLISTECDGCPHKGAFRWRRTSQEIIEELAEFEARFGRDFFLTSQRIPLKQALENINNGQMNFFDSCDSGYCGV